MRSKATPRNPHASDLWDSIRVAVVEALDSERHWSADAARKAVLAEGRTQYEANRVYMAVLERDRKPKP